METPPASENGRDAGSPEVINGSLVELSSSTNGSLGRYLNVNTNGTCFLCLQESSSLSTGHWNIFRYLDITPCSFAKLLEGCGGGHIRLENGITDFSVPICEDCCLVANKMSRLCQELELVQMQLDKCVETVQEIILSSDIKKPVQMEEFQDKVIEERVEEGEIQCGGGVQVEMEETGRILQENFAELLRRETKEKCVAKLMKNRMPEKNEVVVVNDLIELPTTECVEEVNAEVLILKEEEQEEVASSMVMSSEMLPIQDFETEWIPEVGHEILIGPCEDSNDVSASATEEDQCFEQSSSEAFPPLSTDEVSLVTEAPNTGMTTEATEMSIIPPVILSSSNLPPPPPPVNIPRKPQKKHSKKKKITIPVSTTTEHAEAKMSTCSSDDHPAFDETMPILTPPPCPIDFNFREKLDDRHICPFCSSTSRTSTNVRFHVISCHLEQLFSTSRCSHTSLEKFKEFCELMLSTVTKESGPESGIETSPNSKIIAKCRFCRGDSARSYQDKRSFQCHLVANHYQALSQRLIQFQQTDANGEVVMATQVVPPLASPMGHSAPTSPSSSANSTTTGTTDSPSTTKKRKNSGVTTNDQSPKKGKIDWDVNSNPADEGTIFCEHCNKTFASTSSKGRHKRLHCDVLKKQRSSGVDQSPLLLHREDNISVGGVDTDSGISGHDDLNTSSSCASPSSSSVYLVTPQRGNLLNSPLHRSQESNEENNAGLELLLHEAEEMMLAVNTSIGGESETQEEYEQFVNEYQDFYDEDEVNNALIDMMMETVPEGGNGEEEAAPQI